MIKIILKIIVIIFALILILIGLGFFVGSLYLYLATIFKNSTMAAFFSGLSMLLLAILLLLIIILFKRRPKRPRLPQTIDNDNNVDMLNDPIGLFKKYPLQTSVAGLVAGFIFGFSPKSRDIMLDTVMSFIREHSSEKDKDSE